MPPLHRRAALRLAGVAPLLAAMPHLRALAQDEATGWPNRPVKFVVPWPAGGPTDIYARAIAKELSPLLGQPVVIDNRNGATGTVGVTYAARSAADGYTLLVANTTALIGSFVALSSVVQFDPVRDFATIGIVVESSSVLWVNASLPVNDFDALLARARDAKQPRIAFGTTGSGSVSEQSVEQLARHYKLDLLKVPYRGTAPQLVDLIAGHVQIGSADFATAGPHFREGRLRPLLVIGRNRLPELPDVRTTAELGLTDPDFTVWNGLFAPSATPAPIVERLRASLATVVQGEAFRTVANGAGNRSVFDTGTAASERLAREVAARQAFAREVGSGS